MAAITCELDPSLRAATRLEARYGLANLAKAVGEDSLTAALAILAENGVQYDEPMGNLWASLPALQEPLLRYLVALTGTEAIKGKGDDARADLGGNAPLTDYFERLFSIGTGWLGWTPQDTWEATPAEIITAYYGRLDMLKAIFGGTDDAEPESSMSLDDKFKLAFRSLGAKPEKVKPVAKNAE